MQLKNRKAAGRQLGERLLHLSIGNVVVLGLPRGGVPVAFEVARALRAPLDVIIVRKIGLPRQPELAMGAIGEGGVRIVNDDVTRSVGISESQFEAAERYERLELERRARLLRDDLPQMSLVGRSVVVVDDGIATGSTARVAYQVARTRGAARIVLAVPVASASLSADLAGLADEIIILISAKPFLAVGQWYEDFSQTTDNEVVELLKRSTQWEEPQRVIEEPHADPNSAPKMSN